MRKEKILGNFSFLIKRIVIVYKDTTISIYKDGSLYYYKNNQLHKENGPAVINKTNGNRYWFLNNMQYTEEEWRRKIEKQKR